MRAIAALLFVAACEPYATTPRARIARELACTEERTELVATARASSDPPQARRWTAHGCGRAATYLCTPQDDCWRDGEVRDDPHGPQPRGP
jgi:hypothetical protein